MKLRRRLPFALHLFAAALFGASLAAQGRVPLVGRTVLADGSPWPNATVVLHSWVHPDWPQLGVADRITVQSDAQGRFRADSLPLRTYSAWAHEVDAQGHYRASASLAECNAATPVDLRCVGAFRTLRQLRLVGTAPHLTHGPLRLELPRAFAPDDVPIPGDGPVTLPPLPPGPLAVRVRRGDGAPILIDTLYQFGEVQLPPPSPYLVRALDGPGGRPIAGATFTVFDGDLRYELGASDADGYLEADLACLRNRDQFHQPRFHVFVQKEGRQLSILHDLDPKARSAEERAALRSNGQCQAFATLPKGERAPGRLWLAEGVPAAGLPMLLSSQGVVEHRPGATTAFVITRLVTTAADGSFAMDGIAKGRNYDAFALVPPGPGGDGAPTVVPIAQRRPAVRRMGNAAEPDQLQLDTLRRLQLQVALPDGAPALGARVRLALGGHREPVSLRTDRRGRCEVTIAPGVQVDAAIDAGDACWLGHLEGQAPGEPLAVPLKLWPKRALPCQLLASGDDPKGCEFRAELTDIDLAWNPPPERTAGLAPVPGPALAPLAAWVTTPVQSGSDGRGTVLLPSVFGRWAVFANAPPHSGYVPFEVGSGPIEALEIRWRH